MNPITHILMGKIGCKYADSRNLPLNPIAFIWGNVLPDFHPRHAFASHKAAKGGCLEKTKQRLQKLLNNPPRNSARLSKELGMLCHYYTDFFCHPHTSNFSGSLSEHVVYEYKLLRYAQSRMELLENLSIQTDELPVALDAEELFDLLEDRRKFFLTQTPNFGVEMYWALEGCHLLVSSCLEQLALRQPAPVFEDLVIYEPQPQIG